MARDITTGFKDEINANTLRPVQMIHAEFDSGNVSFWTGKGEITWNGITFVGSGDLISISEAKETDTLTANNITIELSGIPSSILSLAFNEPYQNRPVTIYQAVLDENFNIIADPCIIFSGKMDVMNLTDSGSESTISVTCENSLQRLNETDERRFTDEDQKKDYPDDLGFEFVATLPDVELPFGVGRLD